MVPHGEGLVGPVGVLRQADEAASQDTDHERRRMNLLVCKTHDIAERAISLLGMDKGAWRPCGMLEALFGNQFDLIVVLADASDIGRPVNLGWIREDLPLKLSPGGKVRYL